MLAHIQPGVTGSCFALRILRWELISTEPPLLFWGLYLNIWCSVRPRNEALSASKEFFLKKSTDFEIQSELLQPLELPMGNRIQCAGCKAPLLFYVTSPCILLSDAVRNQERRVWISKRIGWGGRRGCSYEKHHTNISHFLNEFFIQQWSESQLTAKQAYKDIVARYYLSKGNVRYLAPAVYDHDKLGISFCVLSDVKKDGAEKLPIVE